MQPATVPTQRPPDARLLAVDADGVVRHLPRTSFVELLRPGDLLVANDAATLPASLSGVHERTSASIEVRLASIDSLANDAIREPVAVVFGAGDHRTRTEHRMPPPRMFAGDALDLGGLRATVLGELGHPRLLRLRFHGELATIWAGIARHGRPIQYAHVSEPLALWDVWTPFAARAVAFEPPSAGFVLDWRLLGQLARRGVGFVTLTHAAGISSTGDPELDARLPLPEPYEIPAATVRAIAATRRAGGRVIAIGTTVTRTLEHAAARPAGVAACAGVATQRIGAGTELRVVDAILTGAHEPGESHYELLRAFAGGETLTRTTHELEGHGYRTHEFGDSLLLERARLHNVSTAEPDLSLSAPPRAPPRPTRRSRSTWSC